MATNLVKELNELKSEYVWQMQHGGSPQEIKKIAREIKSIETQIRKGR